jgi:two-component system, cell cycle sensor histidine kinase and response regulator CckA
MGEPPTDPTSTVSLLTARRPNPPDGMSKKPKPKPTKARAAARKPVRTDNDAQLRRLAAQLDEERQRLIEAQRVAKVGNWETDLVTLEMKWSLETHRIFGTNPASFKPTHPAFLQKMHPDDRAAVDAAFRRSAQERGPNIIEHRLLTSDGVIKHVEERWQVIFDEKRQPVRATGTCQDITDRKRAEDERDRLFNHSPDLLCVAGFDGRLQQVNPAWTQSLGWTAAELTSRPMLDFVHPDDRAVTLAMRERIQLGAAVRGFENRYRARDGTYHWFSWSVYPLPDMKQVFGVARDVTERKQIEEASRRSQALLGMATRMSRLGAWQVDVPGGIVMWSEEAGAIHETPPGFTPTVEEAIDFHAPECRADIRAVFAACAERGVPFDVEQTIITAKGRRTWVRVLGEAVRDAAGKIIRVQGAVQDISERKEAQEETRRLAERFVTTLESITDAFFTLDRKWRFTFLNREAERLLQRSRAELIGRSVWDEFPEAVGSVFERAYHQAMDENRTVVLEEFYAPLNGWFALRIYPSDQGLAVYFREVTESRRTDDKLREQAALLDHANDAIIVRDLEHRVVYWNRSAERLYGWTAAEAIGRSVQELIHGISNSFADAMRILLAKGEWAGEVEQFTKDGRTIVVEGRWTLVCDNQGRPRSILAINNDVTERKKFERQFLRAQRMESIGTLAGGIAHDLNNLLAPIVMGAGLLQRMELPEPGREVLRNIEQSARRGADLVKQVLSFARGVEGERSPLQLGHIIREIASIVANTFPKNIIFEARIAPELWLVSGDATQLNQVLLNLCVNARDAMPEGGRLSITAANREIDAQYSATDHTVPAGRYVVIEVGDSGSGMTQVVMDRIFEPFFTTKELGKGTGLGLSTVLGIVHSHEGIVTVQSQPNHGSIFRVWLPAHADQPGTETPAAAGPALISGRGELILVVDDEEAVLVITKQTLETFGYQVLTARDGAQAVGLYALQQQKIAAVLTDLMMPVMDGPMLIASLQRINPKVRVVAATGLKHSDYRSRAVGLGVKHFLIKPFTAEALLTMMHKVLTEPLPSRGTRPMM